MTLHMTASPGQSAALSTAQLETLQRLWRVAGLAPTSGYGTVLVALAVASDPGLVGDLTSVDFADAGSIALAVEALHRWRRERCYGAAADGHPALRRHRGMDMQSIAFAAPYLPGKTDVDREAMRACTNGERKADYEASRQRHGITREAVSIQATPNGDIAVVYLEADDLQAAFAGLATSTDPFDEWFRDIVREVHGIDLSQEFPPPEQLVDFRA
jgi:hypothetical protein